MSIPAGIENGQLLRLKNKGFKQLNRYKNGNQYVRINVRIPKSINNEMKSIVESLQEINGSNVEFKKIKE